MTKTVLHREQLPISQDLGAMLQALEKVFLEKGQVICQFFVNDLKITESDEKRLSQIAIDEIEKIEIESETPQALVFGLMENWITELPVLIKSSDFLANEIKFNGLDGHFKSFVDLIDSCQFLMESLISLENILHKAMRPSQEWREAERLTTWAVSQAIKTFEAKEFVLLAEILEYDLGNALQSWLEQLKTVNQFLKDESAKDKEGFSERIFQKTPAFAD